MRPKLGFATAAALAVALALVLAACGGDSDSGGVASLTDTTGQSTTESQGSSGSGPGAAGKEDRREATLEFAKCMRKQGVDFPDPVNGRFEFRSERGDQKKVEDAQRACQGILEDAAPQLSEEQEAELREAALDFAKCMREHGVDMPDPEFSKGGGTLMRAPRDAENDPQFEEAQKACEPILEAARPGEASGDGGSS